MSLPASNRKAPSRAVIAATLTAFAALGASTAIADTAPHQGYGFQPQIAPGYGYAAPQSFPGYGIQPASTFGGITSPGYAQPGYAQPGPAQVAPGYGVPQSFPGYGPAPVAGYDPYAGYGPFDSGAFAPSEPTYAPYERSTATAAAPAPVEVPEAKSTVTATVPVTTPEYTYEVTPASGSTYVGNSAQMSQGPNPYEAVQQQYESVAPNYTQQYETVAPAPAPAPAPEYTIAVPAPAPAEQAPVQIGGYEYQNPPGTQYVDLGDQAAPSQVIAAPAAVVPAGTHFVQVGAFLDPNRAANLIAQLGASGVQAFSVPAQVRGKLYHRVRIGAASKRDAELVLDQVRGLNYYEARIVRG